MTIKNQISDFLESVRPSLSREQWSEAYQSWARGGNGWNRALGLGGTDTQTAIAWYQFIHRPGSKEWRPSVIVRALIEATGGPDATCKPSAQSETQSGPRERRPNGGGNPNMGRGLGAAAGGGVLSEVVKTPGPVSGPSGGGAPDPRGLAADGRGSYGPACGAAQSGMRSGGPVAVGGGIRVLIACEFSGTVRDAFLARGHDAWSCDILPTEAPGPHYHCDVRDVLGLGWDLMIAHPPCTHLAVSGARWFKVKVREQADALAFVRLLMDAPIPRVALENPVSVISSRVRRPDQVIQPWQFGHGETKATCLWLRNLPRLVPTDVVAGREARVWRMPPGPDRWKLRSKTFAGVAAAMADQWGGVACLAETGVARAQ